MFSSDEPGGLAHRDRRGVLDVALVALVHLYVPAQVVTTVTNEITGVRAIVPCCSWTRLYPCTELAR
jgi:hypothetical protein